MGYFSNGDAGMNFEDTWCVNCAHYGDPENGESCPVWDAHLLFSYELCSEKKHPGKVILDMLIPHDCSRCAMFVGRTRDVLPGQLSLLPKGGGT